MDRPRARPASPGVCLSLQVNQDVIESFQRGRQSQRRRMTPRVHQVLRTVYRVSPWLAALSLLKAAA